MPTLQKISGYFPAKQLVSNRPPFDLNPPLEIQHNFVDNGRRRNGRCCISKNLTLCNLLLRNLLF